MYSIDSCYLENVFGSQATVWEVQGLLSSGKGGHREAMLNRSHDYIGCYMYQTIEAWQ